VLNFRQVEPRPAAPRCPYHRLSDPHAARTAAEKLSAAATTAEPTRGELALRAHRFIGNYFD
jgi:hypothetical protein